LESVIVTGFKSTEEYSSLDLTIAMQNISGLPVVEKENVNI
jgi:hypothetical protein